MIYEVWPLGSVQWYVESAHALPQNYTNPYYYRMREDGRITDDESVQCQCKSCTAKRQTDY